MGHIHAEYCVHAPGIAYLASDANDCSRCSHRRLYRKDFTRREASVFFVPKMVVFEGCWSLAKTCSDECGVTVKVRNVD